MNNFIQSKKFKIAAAILGIVLIALVSFVGGIAVGFRKARFSYAWGQNYERNFMGPRPGGPMAFFHEMEGREFRNAHGTVGSIISINENNLVIKDRDNKENTVAVTDKTIIKQGRSDLKITDLKPDDKIIVIGKPGNDGTINADLIRVFSTFNPTN